MTDNNPTRRVAVQLPADIWRRIKILAATEEKTMAQWLEDNLRIILKKKAV